MEKIVEIGGGHVVLTYFESCDSPRMKEGKVDETQMFTPRNSVRDAIIYGTDANTGQTVKIRLAPNEIFHIANAYRDIQEQKYPEIDYDTYSVQFCC